MIDIPVTHNIPEKKKNLCPNNSRHLLRDTYFWQC